MQATSVNSSTSHQYSSPKSEIFYDLSGGTLFQNMLKDPEVSKYVEQEPDGSYKMTWTENKIMSSKQCNALSLIRSREANAGSSGDAAVVYLQSDLDLFRKITGYNLIISGGSTICDDFGNDVLPGDVEKAEAARILVDSIASARGMGYISNSAIELSDMPDILSTYGGTFGSNPDIEEKLLKDLMKALGGTDAQVAQLRRNQSIGVDGEPYSTWSLPVNFQMRANIEHDSPTEELMNLLA